MKPLFQKCYSYTTAEEARKRSLYPFFHAIQEHRGGRVIIDGREMLMAGTNNYLGLSLDPRVRQAAAEAVEAYGTSCSGSRFMNGTLDLHEELEKKLSEFTGREDALCFTTGYQTNLGAISALASRGIHILSDRLNHASIMDGIFLGDSLHPKSNLYRFKHRDTVDLEKKLSKIPQGSEILIITDGVFSMEGDICHLPHIHSLSEQYNAGLYLDEAHAIGVIGETGRGTEEHWGYTARADLLMCTFSKAFGSIGGFVAGKKEIVDFIRHAARPLMFSASMPPSNIAAALKALEIIRQEPQRIQRLRTIGKKMAAGFKAMGFDVGPTETPIIPIITKEWDKTILLWRRLFDRGVYVNPVIPPAVPPNRCLLRTSYTALHEDGELDEILRITEEEASRMGILH